MALQLQRESALCAEKLDNSKQITYPTNHNLSPVYMAYMRGIFYVRRKEIAVFKT